MTGPVTWMVVEFDFDADDVADGTVELDSDGTFTYLPEGLAPGTIAVRARALEETYFQDQYSDWTSLTFELLEDAPPVVSGLQLRSDTGSSDSDGITADPTVIGSVTNDDELAGVTVEFDYDGDDVVDASATIDDLGDFQHTPLGLADGSIDIRARGSEWDAVSGTYLYGDWVSLSFVLDMTANAAPQVATFALAYDTGTPNDGITSDPTVVGSTSDDISTAFLTIEVDCDGDQIADGRTMTDEQGEFTYTPLNLPAGSVSLAARAVEWDARQQIDVYGDWVSLSFTLDPEANNAPGVTACTCFTTRVPRLPME